MAPRLVPPNIPEAPFGAAIEDVARAFGTTWLENASKPHPVRTLWAREDLVAGVELFALGRALSVMSAIDPRWVANEVGKAKRDASNCRGPIFEILGLSMLVTGEQSATPMRSSNPGFDGILSFGPEQVARLSLKDYGMSSHQRLFEAEAGRFREAVRHAATQAGINGVCVRATADASPRFDEWRALRENVPALLHGWPQRNSRTIGSFAVVTEPLGPDYEPLDPAFYSDHVFVAALMHPNEEDNLYSKLGEAYSNLAHHAPSDELDNLVLVHLPASASATHCREWASEFFTAHPDKDLSGVIFYKPQMASEPDGGHTTLALHVATVSNDARRKSLRGKVVELSTHVGKGTTEPRQGYQAAGEYFLLDKHYMFQRGLITVREPVDANGNATLFARTPAPGVIVRSSMVEERSGRTLLLRHGYPDSNDLLIL